VSLEEAYINEMSMGKRMEKHKVARIRRLGWRSFVLPPKIYANGGKSAIRAGERLESFLKLTAQKNELHFLFPSNGKTQVLSEYCQSESNGF